MLVSVFALYQTENTEHTHTRQPRPTAESNLAHLDPTSQAVPNPNQTSKVQTLTIPHFLQTGKAKYVLFHRLAIFFIFVIKLPKFHIEKSNESCTYRQRRRFNYLKKKILVMNDMGNGNKQVWPKANSNHNTILQYTRMTHRLECTILLSKKPYQQWVIPYLRQLISVKMCL